MADTEEPAAEQNEPAAEIIEPAPQPVSEPLAAKPVVQRRPSLLGPVMGGVVAAAIGFGAAQLVPDGWPIADSSALEAKLATQDAEIKSLAARLDDLAKAPAAPDVGLADRLTAVEAAVATLPTPDTTALEQRLTTLEQRLAAIESAPGDGTAASGAALAQLQSDVATLKSGGPSADALQQASAAIDAKLAEAESRIAAIKSEADATARAAATRSALRQIAAALDSGAPYTAAIADLGETALPPVLADNAKTGLPSQQSLIASFPEAARAALDASLRASMGESWTDRVSAFLRNQTGARSLTPRTGNDPDAVLSRAEAALNSGDLATVLTELAALPPEGQAAMADWQARCALRQAAISAVQSLSAATGG